MLQFFAEQDHFRGAQRFDVAAQTERKLCDAVFCFFSVFPDQGLDDAQRIEDEVRRDLLLHHAYFHIGKLQFFFCDLIGSGDDVLFQRIVQTANFSFVLELLKGQRALGYGDAAA